MGTPNFWNDRETAQQIIDACNAEKHWVDRWEELDGQVGDLDVLFELACEEGDAESLSEVAAELPAVGRALDALELQYMLGNREDRHDAILTIHPGAGGTEAADWAQMLMRMYTRWPSGAGFRRGFWTPCPARLWGLRARQSR